MKAILRLAAFAAAVGFAVPAHAELGPCKPDSKSDARETLVCGSGNGAARVIPDTVSPNGKFAFAWRDPNGSPDVEPPGDNEWLLLRLADGAVLAKGKTDYFHTGTMRANRRHEDALWSPDSHFALRNYTTRYETEALTAFALARDGASARETDLLKAVENATRARLKRRGRDISRYALMVSDQGTLANSGALRLEATLFVIKQDPSATFRIDLNLMRSANTFANKALTARIAGVKLTEEQP